jgi:hypothetical protein
MKNKGNVPSPVPESRTNLPADAHNRLMQHLERFAERVQKDRVLAPYLRSDLRGLRSDLIVAAKNHFRLKTGRRGDPRLDRAYELQHLGKSIKEILREQFKDYDQLDPYKQYLLAKGLRQAIRRRKTSQKVS